MIVLRFPCAGFPPIILALTFFGSSTALYGVSSIDLPAYLFSSGFTSKVSTWLTPPQRKIQITDFAFGGKCGPPSGAPGFPAWAGAAAAIPSWNSIAPSTKPVKPMPVSARKVRRVTPRQPARRGGSGSLLMAGVLRRRILPVHRLHRSIRMEQHDLAIPPDRHRVPRAVMVGDCKSNG